MLTYYLKIVKYHEHLSHDKLHYNVDHEILTEDYYFSFSFKVNRLYIIQWYTSWPLNGKKTSRMKFKIMILFLQCNGLNLEANHGTVIFLHFILIDNL